MQSRTTAEHWRPRAVVHPPGIPDKIIYDRTPTLHLPKGHSPSNGRDQTWSSRSAAVAQEAATAKAEADAPKKEEADAST